jgi:hypothetical protein
VSGTDPVAYAYDAALHCPECARERFGTCPDGWIACPDHGAEDRESNAPGAVFPWDSMPCHSACADCGEPLPGSECADGGQCCDDCPGCTSGRVSPPFGTCPDCNPRAAALARIIARDGLPNRPGTGYRPTLRGDLWHALTGRTSPERGQLALFSR